LLARFRIFSLALSALSRESASSSPDDGPGRRFKSPRLVSPPRGLTRLKTFSNNETTLLAAAQEATAAASRPARHF
jgi:hypothetical protein